MEHLLDELLTILQNEHFSLEQLLTIAEKKVNALIKRNVKLVEELVEQEQEIKLTLNQLDVLREQTVEALQPYLPQIEAPVTIKKIIDVLPFEQRVELSAIRVIIQSELQKLNEMNQLNSELIQNQLSYIDFMMNMFTGQRVQTANYGVNGYAQNGSHKNSLFDNKV